MTKFCFVCGEKTDDLKDGQCKKCYGEKISLIKVPKEIKLIRCKKCGFIMVKNSWVESSIENAILKKVDQIAKNVELEVQKKDSKYEVIAENGKKETYEVKVSIKEIVCPICARSLSDYYEAVLQIRGFYTNDILNFISEQLFLMSKKNRKAFHTVRKVKGGLDIRIGSKIAAHKLSEVIKRKFGCKIVKSYVLVGKKEGKNLYRNVVSMRF